MTEKSAENVTDDADQAGTPPQTDKRPLTDAARRALAEAEARRKQAAKQPVSEETGGRGGLDPVRYGDWERKGLISDF